EWMAYNESELAVLARPNFRAQLGKFFLNHLQLRWDRYDLKTGQRLEPSVQLWPWEGWPGAWKKTPRVPVAALAVDGKRLAMCDPADPTRVDVWDQSGTRLMGIVPGAPPAPIEWLAWSADGKLLTLIGGRLTGWHVPSGKAAYEVDGGYDSPGD